MPHAEAALRGQRRAEVAERDRPAADHPGRHHRRRLPAGAGRRFDPFGRRHRTRSFIVGHSVRDRTDAVLPGAAVPRRRHRPATSWEYRRPVGVPGDQRGLSRRRRPRRRPTPTETLRPAGLRPTRTSGALQADAAGPLPRGHHAGPGVLPHRRPARRRGRAMLYENAQTPWQTDQLNEQHIGKARRRRQPARRPDPVLGVPDRAHREPDRLRDAVQPRRRPRLRLPHLGLDPQQATPRPWTAPSSVSSTGSPWWRRGWT